jgi:Maltokinase N-terminal cap domain
MAQIHQATVTPAKLDLLEGWLPTRQWYPGEKPPDLDLVGSCRFDDPAGEVGVETMVVRTGDGTLLHCPLTYRSAPLERADYFLIGTLEHSVLGTRWVYDGVGDPVYLGCLAETIRTGSTQAEELVETADGPQRREPLMTVHGTGTARATRRAGRLVRVQDGQPAVVVTETARLEVRRILTGQPAAGAQALCGSWPGQESVMILAVLES